MNKPSMANETQSGWQHWCFHANCVVELRAALEEIVALTSHNGRSMREETVCEVAKRAIRQSSEQP